MALSFCLALGVAEVGGAAPSQVRPAPRFIDLDTHMADLRNGDAERAAAAVAALGKGGRRSVEALRELIEAGQPDLVTDRAIEALGLTGSPEALPILTRLARHRRAGARRLAYSAIARIDDPAALPVLADGLRDSDASVRGVSAQALGELRAVSQQEMLFRALDRGVPEAAPAIGKMGDAASVARFHEQLERLPMNVMLSGYAAFLDRPDLEEAAKLDIVARLGEVAGASVKAFLEQRLAETNWKGKERLRHAVSETARRIDPAPPAVHTGRRK